MLTVSSVVFFFDRDFLGETVVGGRDEDADGVDDEGSVDSRGSEFVATFEGWSEND